MALRSLELPALRRRRASPRAKGATMPRGPSFRRERALHARGLWPVAGIDEAGRGPLAGPVAAAAVVLDPRRLPKGVDDSKALTSAGREAAFERIMAQAVAVAVGFASPREIDRINIRQATFAAMARAVAALALPPRYVLLDGNDMPPTLAQRHEGETLIDGDALCLSIAAASIVAKVTRDRLMRRLDAHHPQYGFARHMGYATRSHRAALAAHGPSPHHRMSFAPLRAPE